MSLTNGIRTLSPTTGAILVDRVMRTCDQTAGIATMFDAVNLSNLDDSLLRSGVTTTVVREKGIKYDLDSGKIGTIIDPTRAKLV